jgi:hypothetical protein
MTTREDGAKTESEELRRYALEIMGLDPPVAVCALIRAASDLIIEKFPSDRWELLWTAAMSTIAGDITAAQWKEKGRCK